jgi:general L-amino acid transport system substrate-binding protein
VAVTVGARSLEILMRAWLALAGIIGLAGLQPAHADTATRDTLAHVRAEGVLQCGSTVRPGLAFPDAHGVWHGLNVDLCRAVATAVLGPHARIGFHPYLLPASYGPVRHGTDELFFLTTSEMIANDLAGAVQPGPAVFYETDAVLVSKAATARHVADLAGTTLCAEPGTGAERSIAPWFAARHLDARYFPFQESDEELDAFYAQRCGAMVNEVTSLAALRLQTQRDGHDSRILPDALASYPILAATPLADGRWSALVTWTIQSVMRPQAGDAAGVALGLKAGWADEMHKAVGPYDAIFARNLGEGSVLDLPAGLNTIWTSGGVFSPAYAE